MSENEKEYTLCGLPSNETLIWKDGYSYVRCKYCGLVYLRPQPSPKALKDFYNLTYHVDFGRNKKTMPRKARWFLKESNKFTKPGSLLELGCSYGFFLKEARADGWRVKGLEWSKQACNYAVHELNLDVSDQSLHEFSLDSKEIRCGNGLARAGASG